MIREITLADAQALATTYAGTELGTLGAKIADYLGAEFGAISVNIEFDEANAELVEKALADASAEDETSEAPYRVTALDAGSIAEETDSDSYQAAVELAYEMRCRNPLAEIAVYDTFENRNVFELHAPEFGCEATYSIGSDSYAGIILYVSPSGRTVGFSRNRQTVTSTARLDKKGRYRVGQTGTIGIGYARDYRDPSF